MSFRNLIAIFHSGARRAVSILVLLGLAATLSNAQQNRYLNNIGIPSFTVAAPVENGFVNVANGNLHLEIPIQGSFPQRGGRNFQAVIMYDSAFWIRRNGVWWPTNGYSYGYGYGYGYFGGWRIVTSADTGSADYTTSYATCYSSFQGANVTTEIDFNNFSWTAPDGTQHLFPIRVSAGFDPDPGGDCVAGQTVTTGDAFATDRSGYHMYVATNGNSQISTIDVYAPDGTHVYGPDRFATTGPRDTNGNYYSHDANKNPIDTLGRSPIVATTVGNSTYIDVLDSHGDTHRYTIIWQDIDVNTSFGEFSTTEYNSTTYNKISVIQEIDLPDTTKYTFTYDQGTTAGHYGLLTGMTLPTGGQIAYTYTTFTENWGYKYRWVNGRTTSGTGIASGTWSYTPQLITSCTPPAVNCSQKVTVTTPSSDSTVYTFNMNGGPWASQVQYYAGSPTSGTLLTTTNNSFDYGTNCPPNVQCNNPGAAYVVKQVETTILPIPGGTSLNQSRRLTWDASKNGNVNKLEEWLFYTGSLPTAADRTTNITYLTGSNYASRNIINKPTNVVVMNKNGATVSQIQKAYDGSALASATGKTNHDDANFGTSMTYRGNLTQIQRLVSGTTYLTTSTTYDMTGQVQSTTDSKGNQTTYDYTDNFYDDPGDGSTPAVHSVSTPTNAYVKKITSPIVGSATLTTSFGYYWGTGKSASVTDANGQISYSHFYDALDRSTSTALPNGEWTLLQFNSTETQIDSFTGTTNTSASTSCTVCRHDRSVLDALGRPITQNLVNDPDGSTTTATTYDSSGRIATVSNPYRSTSDPTYGLETPGYDGLGRTIQSTHADGDVAHVYYGAAVTTGGGTAARNCSASTYGLGYPVLVVDETGNKRQSWTNGFGRIIEADEPNSSGTLSVGTCYTYDSNNNLTGVSNTTTSQTRSYSYDLLSRVTATTLPESGTTNFYYTTTIGGLTLCSGDPSATCLRKDARNITTTYAYDALNRLTSTTYSDSTPTVSYFYDQTSYNGLTITNGNGRRTGMSDGSGQTAWSYDSVGNVLTEQRTIKGVTKAISYTHNPDSTIATITYPGGRVITYTESNAQRMTDAKDIGNAQNYATSATYAPPGGISSVLHGYVSGGFAGVTESYTYNNRLQFSLIQATSTAGLALSLTYSYAQSSHNNGDITTQNNGVNSGRTQTYAYDNLRRLLTAQSQATSGTDCWGLSFGNGTTAGDDALNNLLNQSLTKCGGWTLNVGVNTNNQITNTGISYDSSGNNTADGSYSYTYDAENRIVSASGMSGGPYCYFYDGNGIRVAKAHGASCTSSPPIDVLYWRSIAGDAIAETDASGNTSNEYVFFNGKRIAKLNLGAIDVRFTNDSCSGCGGNPVGGGDRNLFVNSITAGSTVIPASDPSVSYTVPTCNGGGTLACNGDMIANTPVGAPGQTIAVNAYGSMDYNIYPHMQLWLNGILLAEWDVTGSAQNYSVAIPSTAIQYYFTDHLGSTRAMTQANGTVCFLSEYYPYGQELNTTSSCSTNYKFTGYERDTETGIDYAFARYYNPHVGRFMSGDPLGGDISDPQTLNRYTYTRNNPINLIDMSGLDSIDPNFCEASMSGCGGDNGGGLGGPSSFVRKTWNDAMMQYLQQVYNSNVIIGPDGNIYRPTQQICSAVALPGAPQNCIVIPGFQVGQSAGGIGGGARIGPANNKTPWYKNSCIKDALGDAALHVGIDAIGLIPEAGGIARVIGHQAGYVGVVADRLGAKVIKGVGGSTSASSGLAGLGDTSPDGLVSTGLTVAGFIPGAGQVVAGASVVWDVYRAAKAIGKCN